jgi:AcrR family transcriptional regulator
VKSTTALAPEGLRQRKRRATRTRLVDEALTLFLARGYEATTVDDIAAAAGISKRSFFDYFPTKEDVVLAWQDAFGEALVATLAKRPLDEPPARAVEAALTQALSEAAAQPLAYEIDALIQRSPALKVREHVKYVRLEESLAEALIARDSAADDPFASRLLAMLVAGAMRLAAARVRGRPSAPAIYVRDVFTDVWEHLASFATSARP